MRTDRINTGSGDDHLDVDLARLPEPIQAWVKSLGIPDADLEFAQMRITYSYEWRTERTPGTDFGEEEEDSSESKIVENFFVCCDDKDHEIPYALFKAHERTLAGMIADEEHIV